MASCGLTNLGSCLIDNFIEALLTIFNAPIQPILDFTKMLLSQPVNVGLFSGIWAIMVYILSIFYGLLFVYAGFNFIISGYDSERRENAKTWLKNIVIMIVLMQASYFLYESIIDLSSLMTAGVIGMIDEKLFLFNGEGMIVTMGVGIVVLIISYVFVLLVSCLLLLIRYIIVSIGVAFFPLAIFLYYIPTLKQYGSKIMYGLMVNIFIPFIASIILLASAKLTELPAFQPYRIIVMIAAFLSVDVAVIYMIYSVLSQSQIIQKTKSIAVQAYTGIKTSFADAPKGRQASLKEY